MKILIVAHFTQIPSENGNNRFNYLARLLGENPNNQVELITSGFSHKLKKRRELKEEEKNKLNYKLTMLDEPGYKKNVSLKRFYSHYKMSINLKKYLNELDYKPDVIYCAVPSLDVAKVTAKYAKKNNIKFIIDVQDLWPEAFKMVFNIPIISDMIFFPMKRQADYIYKQADDIIAVSDTYLNRVTTVNKKYKNKLSIYLGTDLQYFDQCRDKNLAEDEDGKIKIAYIGTLGNSYDIKIIIDALEILGKKYNNLKFLVMGDGPLKEEFIEYAKNKESDIEFAGRLDYPKMVGRLCGCDIAVNPIKHGSAGSIINKVADYAAAGLPVINTQENDEYRNVIQQYNIGFNCENNNVKDIAQKIEKLINDKKLRVEMGKNNRILAEEKFDRKKTYKEIYELVVDNDRKNKKNNN